ncbi:TNF receptor-associated factor 5-like isoform X2 [Dermacentor albipictus]|uniref:TNF receptor-associated factor 5-like isoform X2 n=1 Tax=Dermacentor albipictus TaxID=60249 RepID=UPI0038FCAD1F
MTERWQLFEVSAEQFAGVSQSTYVPSAMASQGKRHTLCGFAEELDWRPLRFVEPIPAHRICDACGVLPRVTVFLPCRHVLCKSCYEQCVLDDGRACPLDGGQFLPEDAEWRDFPLQNLLGRKVKCWNEERGCNMVLAASELNKHFCNDCDHHSTSCPNCSETVLRSNVAAHLQSKCQDYVIAVRSTALEKSDSDRKIMMVALNANFDLRMVEMKERLDEVISDHIAQNDHLINLSRAINTVKETLLQRSIGNSTLDQRASQSTVTLSSVRAVEETLTDHRGEVRMLSAAIAYSIKELKECLEVPKRTVNKLKMLKEICDCVKDLWEAFGKVLDDAARTFSRKCTGSVAGNGEVKDTEKQGGQSAMSKEKELALSTINVMRYEFIFKGCKAMKDDAYSKGFHSYSSEKSYISGYHLSPGVYLRKEGDHVLLHPRIQLHKGVIDECLQWPFSQNIQVAVIHPSQSKQCQKVWKNSGVLKLYGRPQETSNVGCYCDTVSFRIDDLEREGYVAEDKLHIVWELLA